MGMMVVSIHGVPREHLSVMRHLLLVLALVGAVAGCGGGGSKAGGACGAEVREAFDPNSLQHVLPGARAPEYLTNPPTSGPHVPGPKLSGVRTEVLDKPTQVGALEAGSVLVQYRDLDAAAIASLSSVAGDQVVVAPNPDLPDKVVITAWVFKQTCSSVDTAAIGQFVTTHRGNGPGIDG
jgi:hypothetical protein